jgi:hypothetical protein
MPTTDTAADETLLHPRRRPWPRRTRSLGVALTAGALLVATACSADDDSGGGLGGGREGGGESSAPAGLDVGELDPALAPEGYEASADFLRQVVDESEAQPFRFEMTMSLHATGGGESVDTDMQMLSGEQSGANYRQVVDIGQALEDAAAQTGESVPDELTGDDAVVETVGDSESLFVRAPFVASAGDALAELGASTAMYDLLGVLGDSWGFVDLTQAGGTVTGQAASTLGSNGFDPRAMVDTLQETGEVSELGSSEIDDTPVTGLASEPTLGAMLEAQGMDATDFVQQMGAAAEIPEDMLAAVTEIPVSMEAWMSQDGHLRQLRMVMDTDFMRSLVQASGGDTSSFEEQVDEYEQLFVVDYLDYGDESIQVELPDRAGAVDITDDYVAALGA